MMKSSWTDSSDTATAIAVIVIIAVGVAAGFAICMPIAFVLIWGTNTVFGLALPLTWTSVAAGAAVLMCLRFILK